MTNKSTNSTDCSSGSCPVNQQEKKLVKSTELPIVGNPYPPKDVIQEDDKPNSLELGAGSIRTSLQPYLAPVCKAYRRTQDVLSIGAAHSQSAIQNLADNQNLFLNTCIVAGAGLIGWTIARRKGVFKKAICSSVLVGGAMTMLYPQEARERAGHAWFAMTNTLPQMASSKYAQFSESRNSSVEEKSMNQENSTGQIHSETKT